MSSSKWQFDSNSQRYRDLDTGRFLSKNAVVQIRDDIVEAASKQAKGFSSKVANGSMSPGEFGAEMRKLVKTTELANYSLGRGGVNAMTSADYGTLGRELKSQYGFIDGFVRDLETKDMTPEQIEARANLYFDQSIKAHELGKAAAMGVKAPDVLPPLHALCRCSLSYSTQGDDQVVFWVTADGPCPECGAMADEYNPLILMEAA